MTDTTKHVVGRITPQMIRGAAGWSQSEDDLRDTLGRALDELERALAAAPADDEEYTETCPICAEPFKLGDMCATDIELGQSHAECLEGCPTVDLETGEEIEGPITNYPYEPDPASTQARSALSEAPAPEGDLVGPADQIISQIEELFPNWRSYRDLVDCIECTLHDLRKDAGREA
jgi:hypothetical protein